VNCVIQLEFVKLDLDELGFDNLKTPKGGRGKEQPLKAPWNPVQGDGRGGEI
jgi:hypothetical protein